MAYTLSDTGVKLIAKFEGCKLTAYKPVATEKYYTIGYGHYGADVTKGMTITQAQAEALLKSDCDKFVAAVNKYASLSWMNQNRFDALVSFTYNCGAANLAKLLANGTRTATEVSDKLPAYNKSSGKVLKGLVNRRAAEKELFDKDAETTSVSTTTTTTATTGISPKVGCVYTTTVNLNVRKTPSTSASILKTYTKGTRFTVKEVKQDGKNVWLRTPSGWIAGYYNGKFYFE